MTEAYTPTVDLPTPLHQGKVRDVYDLDDRLLLVATDRVSAFDCILPDEIPDKGRILTGISDFWFRRTESLLPNHLVSTNLEDLPEPFRSEPWLRGRSMLVRRAKRIDVECIVRGFVAGGGWAEYERTGRIQEHVLPANLSRGSRLEEPLFTPSTKADEGHDRPIPFDEMVNMVGGDLAERLRELSLLVYGAGCVMAEERGFLLADTKFEFGLVDDQLILIDEVLTPDSSRYWRKDDYTPGQPPESWDKQIIRDHLEELDWDKMPPAPALPSAVIHRARERYMDVYRALIGRDLER